MTVIKLAIHELKSITKAEIAEVTLLISLKLKDLEGYNSLGMTQWLLLILIGYHFKI